MHSFNIAKFDPYRFPINLSNNIFFCVHLSKLLWKSYSLSFETSFSFGFDLQSDCVFSFTILKQGLFLYGQCFFKNVIVHGHNKGLVCNGL